MALSPVARGTYHRLLEEIYRKWAPEKLGNVPALMEKYAGQEDEVYDKAVRMYVFSKSREHWQPLIEGMYQRFNPSKLGDIEQVLKKYRDSEAGLFKALCDKYIAHLGPNDPPLSLNPERAADAPARNRRAEKAAPRNAAPSPPAPPATEAKSIFEEVEEDVEKRLADGGARRPDGPEAAAPPKRRRRGQEPSEKAGAQTPADAAELLSARALRAFTDAAPAVESGAATLRAVVEYKGQKIEFAIKSSTTLAELAGMYGKWLSAQSEQMASAAGGP